MSESTLDDDNKQKWKKIMILIIIIMFDSYNILKIIRLTRDVGSTWPDSRRNQLMINKRMKLFLTLCSFESAVPSAWTCLAQAGSEGSPISNRV